MPEKDFFIWLESAGVFAWHQTVGGETVSFRVVLLAEIDGKVHCVVRYDCAHGTPHQDILGMKGGTLAKQWFFDSSRVEVFKNAIRDFKAKSEKHIRFYREN